MHLDIDMCVLHVGVKTVLFAVCPTKLTSVEIIRSLLPQFLLVPENQKLLQKRIRAQKLKRLLPVMKMRKK